MRAHDDGDATELMTERPHPLDTSRPLPEGEVNFNLSRRERLSVGGER